ncbi:MAG TPA: ACT domain-containing protein [Streptosporangiaceae bacterium]
MQRSDHPWQDLRPVLYPDPYVFVSVPVMPAEAGAPGTEFAVIREDEGITLVLTQDQADRLGLAYGYVAARITLTIGSALAAVGLTAKVSQVLATAGISCNVIAGSVHDHLFVDGARGPEALALLEGW